MTDYHSYLLRKSLAGFAYRKYFLFPWLASKFTAPTLDIGTGLGEFLDFLPIGSIGIDINPKNVDYACSLGRDVRLCSSTFPFPDSSWSQLVCDQVIEHLTDPNLFLSEVRRVLTPNGLFVVGLPCESGYRRDPDHKLFYNLSSLNTLMSKYSFVLQSYQYYPLPFRWSGKFFRQQSLYALFLSKG